MKKIWIAFALVFTCLLSTQALADEDLKSIPREMGLPVNVKTSINFLDVKSINENEKTFDAIVDTKLIWIDRR